MSDALGAGVVVGHWTGAATGVTVVLCPPNTVGSAEIRGGAPATREIALLAPERSVEHVDAVVFTGGSSFGLAAADGAMAWLAEQGRGFPTRSGPVPIVPTAAIFDLGDDPPPGAAEGRAAIEAAASGTGDQWSGLVGAGRGATVGKWRGGEYSCPGGVGRATGTVNGATVGALAVVNAVGDVVRADATVLAGSSAPLDGEMFPNPESALGATTLVVVATDARLNKTECHLLAQSGHLGLAHSIRPSHTRHDGDLVVALATGQVEVAFDRLRVVVTDVVAAAIRNSVEN